MSMTATEVSALTEPCRRELVVEMIDHQITALTHFMGPAEFAELGLPDIVEDRSAGTDQF